MNQYIVQHSMNDKQPALYIAESLAQVLAYVPGGPQSVYGINGTIFANGQPLNTVPDAPPAWQEGMVYDARAKSNVAVLTRGKS